jgi:hypothetical protein
MYIQRTKKPLFYTPIKDLVFKNSTSALQERFVSLVILFSLYILIIDIKALPQEATDQIQKMELA